MNLLSLIQKCFYYVFTIGFWPLISNLLGSRYCQFITYQHTNACLQSAERLILAISAKTLLSLTQCFTSHLQIHTSLVIMPASCCNNKSNLRCFNSLHNIYFTSCLQHEICGSRFPSPFLTLSPMPSLSVKCATLPGPSCLSLPTLCFSLPLLP